MTTPDPGFERLRRWITLGFALFAVLGIALLLVAVWKNRYDPELTHLVDTNFPAIVGRPFAAIAAFIVVAVFRQSETPLELEVLGFKFKGAAGKAYRRRNRALCEAHKGDGIESGVSSARNSGVA